MKKQIKSYLPHRGIKAHKGQFGHLCIIAGSRTMTGAALLSAVAALRSGVGLISLGVPESSAALILKRYPEIMVHPLPESKTGSLSISAYPKIKQLLKKKDVLGIGPGLSQEKGTQSLIRRVALFCAIPLVLDADGLNAFSGNVNVLKQIKVPLIITPHPGEFKRLFKNIPIQSDVQRKNAAKKIASQYGATVVLKGHQTVVADPGGRVSINRTGNPGMATGGSGDILLGVIASLLAQGLKPFDAAKVGVYIHGFAGDLAKKEKGVISLVPSDILDLLPRAFQKLRN